VTDTPDRSNVACFVCFVSKQEQLAKNGSLLSLLHSHSKDKVGLPYSQARTAECRLALLSNHDYPEALVSSTSIVLHYKGAFFAFISKMITHYTHQQPFLCHFSGAELRQADCWCNGLSACKRCSPPWSENRQHLAWRSGPKLTWFCLSNRSLVLLVGWCQSFKLSASFIKRQPHTTTANSHVSGYSFW